MSANTGKYIHPRLRNKQTATEVFNDNKPKEKPYEEQFPSLGAGKPSTLKVWGGSTSFAEKAKEWSDHEKVKQHEEELKRREEEILKNWMTPKNLPMFHNVRRFVEEDQESEEDEQQERAPEDESEWVNVSRARKVKTPKTFEQIADEELEDSADNNDQSVWNNDEKDLNETCWDEKNY